MGGHLRMLLAGRRIVATGASGALGEAVMAQIACEGGDAIGLDVRPGSNVAAALDLADPAAAAAAFARIGAHDAVAHLAGGFEMARQDDVEAEAVWSRLFRANVDTYRNCLRAALPHLAPDGAIVAVGANAALRGVAGMGAYCAAKSAVMRLTESLAAEHEPSGPRANAVLPSIIDTPRNRADMPDADPALWVARAALAAVICFLASPRARAVNGALIPVSRGSHG